MRSLILLAVGLCFLATTTDVRAGEPKKLTDTKTWEHPLSISANGKTLVWLADGAAGDRILDIWLMDVAEGKPKNLTAADQVQVGFAQKWTPRLSSDGGTVYFGNEDGLQRIGADGKGAGAMDINWEINEILVVPGKKAPLVTYRGPVPEKLIQAPLPKAAKEAAMVLFDMLWWVDPATKKQTLLDKEWASFFKIPHLLPGGLIVADTEFGWGDDAERAVALMDVQTGKRTRLPMDWNHAVPPGRIGDQLVFWKQDERPAFVLWDLKAKTMKKLGDALFEDFGTFWSIPGGDRAIFTAQVTEDAGWYLYEVDTAGKYRKLCEKKFGYQPEGGGVTPDGKRLYFTAGEGVTRPGVEVWSLDL